jgi:hypothetical protein
MLPSVNDPKFLDWLRTQPPERLEAAKTELAEVLREDRDRARNRRR